MAASDGEVLLDGIEHAAFGYFRQTVNPANGLVADTTRDHWPCSIAVVGFALSVYPVAVERGWMSRDEALELQPCRACAFSATAIRAAAPDSTGYKGFYYHFLDMQSGTRVWRSELSMIDTALLIAGVLTARMYFNAETAREAELRELADQLYRRVDWRWSQDGGRTIMQGWKPESGFLHYGWEGYSESHRAVRARAGLTDAPARARHLQGMDGHLPVGKSLRHRFPVCRAAVHSSILACMDRFSRHPGSFHA